MAYWITRKNGTSYLESNTDMEQEFVSVMKMGLDDIQRYNQISIESFGKFIRFLVKAAIFIISVIFIIGFLLVKYVIPYVYKKLKIRLRERRWLKVFIEMVIGFTIAIFAKYLIKFSPLAFIIIEGFGMSIVTFASMRLSSLVTILLLLSQNFKAFMGNNLLFVHPVIPLIVMAILVIIAYFLRAFLRVRKGSFVAKVYNYLIDWSDDVLSQWKIFRKMALN